MIHASRGKLITHVSELLSINVASGWGIAVLFIIEASSSMGKARAYYPCTASK